MSSKPNPPTTDEPPAVAERPHALRYTGDGTLSVRGVPPRDLTEDDITGYGPALIHSAEVSGLYERVSAPAEKPTAGKGS